jgi:SulP family sulfate permease
VRILLPVAGKLNYHVATFGRGDFFGEISFLRSGPRSANAVALTDVDVFALPRKQFDSLAEAHKRLAMQVMEGIATTLAIRMRRTDRELRALQED